MELPGRPRDLAELRTRIASAELRESRVLEFKRAFPSNNKELAKQIAGLAADGGALVLGVAETDSGLQVAPIDCEGARERVEQIARDIPQPPVQVTSHILSSDTPGHGVLWVEIPASPVAPHAVESTYYRRGDTQTHPMDDSEVEDRMRLRRDRPRLIIEALREALGREEPAAPALYGRTCLVARPVGASSDEFFRATSTHDSWEAFTGALQPPSGPLPPVPHRFWGQLSHRFVPRATLHSMYLASYRDLEFQENGAFCYLSYSQDWLRDHTSGVFPFSALVAALDAIRMIAAVQASTRQQRAWDVAFSISDVEGRTTRARADRFPHSLHQLPIPRNKYEARVLGVSANRLENEPLSIVRELTGRFVDECGLEFDDEWSAPDKRWTA